VDGLINNEHFLMQLTSHQRRLMGYIQVLVQNRADAEELLQEANLYICRHADEFQPGTDFTRWALKIAYYRVLEWRLRRSREKLVFDDSLFERVAELAQSTETESSRRRAALELCMQKLAHDEQQLVTQFYGASDSNPKTVAERLGRSVNGLYVSVHRIRAKLFDCIRRTLAAEERA
jgi:RNA polymerase sigma-70 factor (ECF subfamily)